MAEKPLPALSAAEQALMDLIWKTQPTTATELLDLVNSKRTEPITRNTLQTQLSRLETKGWITRDGSGKALKYLSAVTEKRGRGRLVKELKKRIFGGSALSMMRCLVEEGGISKTEMIELRKLLEDPQSKGGRP